jgi:hypothetical protein
MKAPHHMWVHVLSGCPVEDIETYLNQFIDKEYL